MLIFLTKFSKLKNSLSKYFSFKTKYLIIFDFYTNKNHYFEILIISKLNKKLIINLSKSLD